MTEGETWSSASRDQAGPVAGGEAVEDVLEVDEETRSW